MFTNFLLEIFSNVSHFEIQDTRAKEEKGKTEEMKKKDKYTTVTLTTDCHTDFLGKLYIQIRKMNMNVFEILQSETLSINNNNKKRRTKHPSQLMCANTEIQS